MWLILLLFLPLSSAYDIPWGIQYDSMSEDVLESAGCSLCYREGYGSWTFPEDIEPCPGPILFVGAQQYRMFYWWKPEIFLGAFAWASEVTKRTELNTPHEYNGVYWYFHPERSFGFLADMDLRQEWGPDEGTTNADSRLSWDLDTRQGGWRAGANIGLNNLFTFTLYRKLIYNCWSDHFVGPPNGTAPIDAVLTPPNGVRADKVLTSNESVNVLQKIR